MPVVFVFQGIARCRRPRLSHNMADIHHDDLLLQRLKCLSRVLYTNKTMRDFNFANSLRSH